MEKEKCEKCGRTRFQSELVQEMGKVKCKAAKSCQNFRRTHR